MVELFEVLTVSKIMKKILEGIYSTLAECGSSRWWGEGAGGRDPGENICRKKFSLPLSSSIYLVLWAAGDPVQIVTN
jgi:hypothetical protein